MVDLRTSVRRPVLITNVASLLSGFAMFANMLLTAAAAASLHWVRFRVERVQRRPVYGPVRVPLSTGILTENQTNTHARFKAHDEELPTAGSRTGHRCCH
jgi:hypothetical protein